jgi:aminopeptidase N
MVDYMRSPKDMLRPIMTNSEQIASREFGNNAYGKPAAALSVLRETIMGPELFDYAFKEYSRRWAFKHPDPADFFRTMEDASAIDLDWFWRGWFYSTDNVDVSVEGVKWFKMKNVDKPFENKAKVENKEIKGRKNQSDDPKYAMPFEPSEFYFSKTNKNEYREFLNEVDDDKIKIENSNKNFYEVTFKNKGGLVTPLIIEWTYEDGSVEIEKLPAEIWRLNETQVSKVFAKNKVVKNIKLDPNKETADVNISDNNFPRLEIKSDFEKFRN